jgi:ferritin-like metal-binding protein YciE
MTVLVTKALGGNAKPVGVLYVEPDLQVEPAPAGLREAGVDAGFTADLLSACLAHERCGLHLYRSVAGRTQYDDLRSQYEHFGEETAEHIRLLEEFVTAGGGDPMYVSPSARATEKAAAGLLESTFLLGGSIDAVTAELAMLEAVMLAEAKDHGNWELLGTLAQQMADSTARTLLETMSAQVLAQEVEHYGWARETRATMLLALSTGTAPARPSGSGERDAAAEVDAMTKNELYAKAQELEIEGRSQMNRDELAEAVGAEMGDAQ